MRLDDRAAAQGVDLSYRPPLNGPVTRRRLLNRVDFGNYNKGTLAAWGLDRRDPTADRRLMEFCLTVPGEEYLRGGVQRALARRAFAPWLPAAVVAERRKGFQAADWHVGFAAARDEIAAEIERIARCPPAAQVLDVDLMRSLIERWPTSPGHKPAVSNVYRNALLRAISIGHFMRRAAGSGE
jgi:asparagine synthase (glutamine-hydrolysing)